MNEYSDYLKKLLQNQPGVLSKEEELALIQRTQAGDDDAYGELLSKNLRLVAGIASNYFSDSLEPDDLFQEGCCGFRTAVMKFDVTYDCRLSTYATRWVNQAISRTIQEQGRTIRIPEHVQTDRNKLKRAEDEYIQKYGVAPSEEELSRLTNLKLEKVKEIQRSFSSIDSLDREVNEDGETCLGEFIGSEESESPEMQMVQKDMVEQLYAGISGLLTEREQTVIKRRYGLEDEEIATLDEIGKDLKLTRERVRQIEKQALAKLSGFIPLQAA